MEIKEVITIWKKLKIDHCTMDFNCGGDSMGETSFVFYNQKDKVIESADLESYFSDTVYDRVEFYVNSDGHYQGEAGTVEITLNDDGYDFDYSKCAECEYEEQHVETTLIPMPEPMIMFLKENVANINGGNEEIVINYKKDLLLSDDKEKLLEEIKTLLADEVRDFEPNEISEELNDWRTFTTGEDELSIQDKSLSIEMTVTYTTYEESN